MIETPPTDRSKPTGTTPRNELTTDVVYEVARVSNTDPIDLPPLYNAIDPDALNALIADSCDSTLESITFQYDGYTVTISENGDITVSSTT
ncbi:hypothetical protein QA600_20195 [Natronococcus sp. A-GB1]|uniref:HalOD1 output domain-containing protein n=1 Tax=Natronococcus sp. A-GB1 TaxID=3037648 RepID=UPI00241F059A|nr:HalOD1 output domain-containing protein [Natronococcus sp. A-GB1]MDG5761650.1 hypothetical protein [Natronococcus sp. A-GB1]